MLSYALIGGIMYGLYFGLVGMGLNLIFGVMRMINLAHGDFIMLGAFLTYWLYYLFGFNPLIVIPISIVVFLVFGFLMYYVFVPKLLHSKDPEMLSFILFFGVSQVIEAIIILFFGNNQISVPSTIFAKLFNVSTFTLFGNTFPISWLVVSVACIVAFVLIYVYFFYTKLGYATRAIMANRHEALVSGIDVNKVSAIAFGVGIAAASLAGVMGFFMIGAAFPSMGTDLTTISFTIIVLGALGNPLGTVIGGLIYGVAIMLMQTYFSSWTNVLPYLLLIFVILIKPEGLLGKAVRNV